MDVESRLKDLLASFYSLTPNFRPEIIPNYVGRVPFPCELGSTSLLAEQAKLWASKRDIPQHSFESMRFVTRIDFDNRLIIVESMREFTKNELGLLSIEFFINSRLNDANRQALEQSDHFMRINGNASDDSFQNLAKSSDIYDLAYAIKITLSNVAGFRIVTKHGTSFSPLTDSIDLESLFDSCVV